MRENTVLRIVAGIALLAAIAGVAFVAFNAGMATHLPVNGPANGQAPQAYYGYGMWRPFGFFWCLGPLFGLLLLFFAFRALSFVFWGGRWGHRHYGWRHGWGEEGGVPPMFREWHERAHKAPDEQSKNV